MCFVEQVVGNDRYSLYALEQPVKPCPEKCNHDLCKGIDELGYSINCEWYYGDTLESCLEPCSIKCEDCNDLINKMPLEAIRQYKHFIYPDDKKNNIIDYRKSRGSNMTKYKTIKNRFITEFIEKYSDDSNRHFIQVLKKWRDLEK